MQMNENQGETINKYKSEMYVNCTETDSLSLKKSLAQTVFDGFDFGKQNAVFGVTVEPDTLVPENDYVMALCMVELGDGLSIKQIKKLISILPENAQYMPIEFHAGNTSAYGFICADFFESHNYLNNFFNGIDEVLEDKSLESPDGVYETSDGRKFYMSYLSKLQGGQS